MHLSGDANTGGRAKGVEKGVDQLCRFCEDAGRRLDSFRWLLGRKSGIVGHGKRTPHLAGLRVHRNGAQRGSADIQTDGCHIYVPPYNEVDSKSNRLIISV